MNDSAKRVFRPGAVLFDMDGLMVDSEPVWFLAEKAFAIARGATWTEADWRACVGEGLPATVRRLAHVAGVVSDEEVHVAELVDRFVAHINKVQTKKGCLALVERMRGRLPVAVASSSPQRLVHAVLKQLSLSASFDAVVGGDEVPRLKPEPDIFLEAARRLGVAADRCLVLEDSRAGVTAGKRAGAMVIAVPETDDVARDVRSIADFVVSDLDVASFHIELADELVTA